MLLVSTPSPAPGGRLRARPDTRQTCQLAREVAGAMLDVPAEEIGCPKRSRQAVCRARHVGMYIAHVVFQLPFGAIAEGFQRHRSTVGYAVRQVEDRRDDGGFDELLTWHERRAEALRQALPGAGA